MLDQTKILEYNKLIAEFMGYTVYNKRYPRNHNYGAPEMEPAKYCILEKLKYHKSYDALIPVILEIEDVGYHVDINSGLRRINIISKDFHSSQNEVFLYNEEFRGNSSLYESLTPIECIYSAVINFIKWYTR